MDPETERARRLILQHGWNTTCYQIVNDGIQRWFSERGDAVLGFVEFGGMRVVAGAPVCAIERLPEVIEEWERSAASRVCYFGAEDRLHSALANSKDHVVPALGAQPMWRPSSWASSFANDRSLRAQWNRAANKGVVVEEWSANDAANHPELRRVLDEWLSTRGLPAMHFLVEWNTLNEPGDRRLFVATRRGQVVGFTTLCPIPQRSGWLTEQFVRGQDAPNGTVESCLHRAVSRLADEGFDLVTMGIVPLSPHGEANGAAPGWLRALIPWIRAHGRRFYNFQGLDDFKTKFHPDRWEPIYVISRERKFSPRTLYAIGAAFTEGRPVQALVRGAARALRMEAQRSVISAS